VHAFATDPKRGVFLLCFLAIVICDSLLLYASRAGQASPTGRFDVISRESLLLSNNVLLAVAAASVLLGTLYPLFIDVLGKGKLSVGPPYFNTVFVAVMTPLLFLMGVGPIARWKKASLPELAVLGLLLALWIVMTTGLSLSETIKAAGSLRAMVSTSARRRSFVGMQLAHIGVAVSIIGITVVTGYEAEKDVRMDVGDVVNVAELSGSASRYRGLERRPDAADTASGEACLSRVGKCHDRNGDRFRRVPRPLCVPRGTPGRRGVALATPVQAVRRLDLDRRDSDGSRWWAGG
jgi:cytochrome c-type biogenesis protein CcmF